MTYEEYKSKLPTNRKLSAVKDLMLRTLWEAGDTFPRPWVSSDKLLELSQQKYFDRRLRECRDRLGCDLETAPVDGRHAWRLASATLTEAVDRSYLSASQKRKLFQDHNNTCALCGTQIQAGVRGLQADHKVPLSRGGSNDLENWQPVCHDCNVGKRAACKGCGDECPKCAWAYPERTGIRLTVSVDSEILSALKKKAGGSQAELNRIVAETLRKHHL